MQNSTKFSPIMGNFGLKLNKHPHKEFIYTCRNSFFGMILCLFILFILEFYKINSLWSLIIYVPFELYFSIDDRNIRSRLRFSGNTKEHIILDRDFTIFLGGIHLLRHVYATSLTLFTLFRYIWTN